MPTYGVEKYIKRAIQSIQRQTYTDWELIIVDDCTPDNSIRIAEETAAGDERVRVVHHEKNQGLSAARNTGMSEANGSYIWFMDPDDHVEPDLLQEVYQSLQKNPAKLVVFGHWEEYFDKDGSYSYSHMVLPKEGYYTEEKDLRKEIIYLEQSTVYGYAWNKFYNLEYLRSIHLQYENVKLIEDVLFNVKYCMDIDSMNLIEKPFYHYEKRMDNSLTNKFVPDYYKLHKRRIALLYEQYQYWGMCTREVKEILGSLYGRYILSALQRNCDKQSNMNSVKRYRWCKHIFQQELYTALIPYAKATDSRALAIALIPMKRKQAFLCLILGRIVYIARNQMPMLYTKVRSGR
jgi:glycosyltransferase involved in cell wall biosynthesis